MASFEDPRRPLFRFSSASIDGRRLWGEWFAMGVAATGLLVLLLMTAATTRLDNAIYDLSIKLERRAPRADIVLVTIDPRSFAEIRPWPWPRRLQADLIDRIAKDKPKAMATYLVFATPSTPADDQGLHNAMSRVPTFIPLVRDPARAGDTTMLQTIPPVRSAIAGIGAGEQGADPDGIVRRASLTEGRDVTASNRLVVQMSRMMATKADHSHSTREHALIPYVGPAGSFPIISAATVLEGQSPQGAFHNKYVLVGPNAPGMLDEHPTPTAKTMSNVEIEANILDGLLNRGMIVSATPIEILLGSLPLLWLLLLALLRLGPRDNLRVAAGVIILPFAGSVLALIALDVWVPPVSFLLTVALVTFYWGWRRLHAASDYFAEELRGLHKQIALPGEPLSLARDGDVVLQQMTLLQEAKKRISDLRRFVSDILANFPEPIFVVDLDGAILTANDAGLALAFRLGVSGACDSPIDPILSRIIPMGDADSHWPPLAELAARADALDIDRSLTGRGPDGRTFELRFTPTLSASDQPTGWIVHLADITVMMMAVDQRELAMRQREEALQLLSHDMRSPQASILAVLKHPDFQSAPPKLLEQVETQARRTLDLADAFVRLAQAESADYTLEAIDFSHVAEEAIDAVWSLAQQGGITLDLRIQGEFVIFADRSALMRALVNLLDNAIKFSTRGAAVVCIVKPATFDGGDAVACEISDSAGGMPDSIANRLFDRFATAGHATHESQGIGLGLALVQAVASRHHGSIVCKSALGVGSVFTLTVPLLQESRSAEVLRARA